LETAQAGDGGVGALPVAETERRMAKRAFNSAFCKEALFAMQHGEVTKTFSQLGVLHVSVGGISKVLHPHTKLSQSGLYFV